NMTDVAVLSVQGDSLVSTTLAPFKKEMESLAGTTRRVVVDLSGVQFIDSAGCGTLLQLHKLLQARGGGLKGCCGSPSVPALFGRGRMQRVLAASPTRGEGVRAFQP